MVPVRISLFLGAMALVVSSFISIPASAIGDFKSIFHFSQSAKLTMDAPGSEDHFGTWVAVDGNVIVIGAPDADVDEVVDAGAVYVYVRQSGGWYDTVQSAVLTASDKRAGDGFGRSVAIDGDTIVVGAPTADPGGSINAGAAYFFTKPAGGWAGNLTETGILAASDNEQEDDFGFSVAIDGDVIAVGALDVDVESQRWAGVVYLYLNNGAGWNGAAEDARLFASKPQQGDWFGYCIDIDGDVIAVGSKYSDPGGLYAAGSAYVFVKPAGGWVTMTEDARLLDSEPAVSDRFGGRIGISGDVIVVGADGDNPDGKVDAGAAFVFEMPVGGWVGTLNEKARLTSTVKESNPWNGFGTSAAILGEVIVVGSRLQNSGGITNAGVTYVFHKPASGWQDMTQSYAITASDLQAGDEFGISAAIGETGVVVGAWQEDPLGVADAGSAYVFEYKDAGFKYKTFRSSAAQDGWILESGERTGTGKVVDSSTAVIVVGDSKNNRQYRAILSFNTGGLPEDAVLLSAVLKVKIILTTEGNPFVTLKPLVADIRQPFFGAIPGLESADFQAAAGLNRAGVFRVVSSWGWYSASLTDSALAFINPAGTTQFRLRFVLDDDNDSEADWAAFSSGEAAFDLRPVLIVKYSVP